MFHDNDLTAEFMLNKIILDYRKRLAVGDICCVYDVERKKKGEGRLRFVEHLCRDVYFNWLHILILR